MTTEPCMHTSSTVRGDVLVTPSYSGELIWQDHFPHVSTLTGAFSAESNTGGLTSVHLLGLAEVGSVTIGGINKLPMIAIAENSK